MPSLPATEDSLVLRTDFSDAAAWQTIRRAMLKVEPPYGFRAYIDIIDDPTYDGLTVAQIVSLAGAHHDYLFVVDATALSHPEQPILCVDTADEPGRSFRVIPAALPGVENNLSLANMDVADFAEAADDDGILRNFKQMPGA